jgi:Sigma-54 interaction domain
MAVTRRRSKPAMSFRGSSAASQRARGSSGLSLIEWRTLLSLRPNIMIEGEESHVEKTLVALTGDFRADTCEWATAERSRTSAPIATIVVREVTRLDRAERDRLRSWVEKSGPRVQLIVTSSTPVYRAVECGLFPPDLYYRLNTIVLTTAQSCA